MMRKTAILTTGLVLAASLLAGCGSSGDKKADAGGYCKDLKSAAADISSFTGAGGTPDVTKVQDVADKITKLAAIAPDRIAGDWKLLSDGLNGLLSALDAAGISLQDLAKAAATGTLPEGVTAAQASELGAKVSALQTANFTKAGENITADAKKECGVDLKKLG